MKSLPLDVALERIKIGADFEVAWRDALGEMGVDAEVIELVAARVRPMLATLPTLTLPHSDVSKELLVGLEEVRSAVQLLQCHLVLAVADAEISKQTLRQRGFDDE